MNIICPACNGRGIYLNHSVAYAAAVELTVSATN